MKKNLILLKCSEHLTRLFLLIFTLLIMTQCANKVLGPINYAAQKKCYSFIDESKFLSKNNSIISNHKQLYFNGLFYDTLKYNNNQIFVYHKENNSENKFDLVLGWSKGSKLIDIVEYSTIRINSNETRYFNDKCNQHYNNQLILPTLSLIGDDNKSKIWFSFSPAFLLFSQYMEIQPVNKEKSFLNQEYYYNGFKDAFTKHGNPQRLFLVEQTNILALIELIPINSQEKIKKGLEYNHSFTTQFLSYLNKNKIEFDYLMEKTDMLSSAFYSPYFLNICDENKKLNLILKSCDKIPYTVWENILNNNLSLVNKIGKYVKENYPDNFLANNMVSYLSKYYLLNKNPLIFGNELKYTSLSAEITNTSPRNMLPEVISMISNENYKIKAKKRYIDLSNNKNELLEAKSLYPEMTFYASIKASNFVSDIHDMKFYLEVFPKGFYSEKYNQEIYAYEQELEKQRQKRIQRINKYLIVDQLKQMSLDGIEPLFILSKLKQISNEYPEDLTVVQLETLKHVRFVNNTSKAQNSKSGGIATFFRGTTFSHKSNVGSVYKNELVWVDDLKESYIGLITNPKKLVANILNNKYISGYGKWARRVYTSDIGDYDKPVKVPPSARSQGESLTAGWYIMGALTGAYITYTKGLQYLGSKGYISSGSSNSDLGYYSANNISTSDNLGIKDKKKSNKTISIKKVEHITNDSERLVGKTSIYYVYLSNGRKVKIKKYHQSGSWVFVNDWGETNRGNKYYKSQQEILNALVDKEN